MNSKLHKFVSLLIFSNLLFIICIPIINANNNFYQKNDESWSISINIIGENHFRQNSVKIPEVIAKDIKGFLQEANVKLKNCLTKQQYTEILYDLIEKLNNYNLLTKDINFTEVNDIIFQRKISKNVFNNNNDDISNLFSIVYSLVYGQAMDLNFIMSFLVRLALYDSWFFHILGEYVYFMMWLNALIPPRLLSFILVSNKYDAYGSLFSIGLNGIKYSEDCTNYVFCYFIGLKIVLRHQGYNQWDQFISLYIGQALKIEQININ